LFDGFDGFEAKRSGQWLFTASMLHIEMNLTQGSKKQSTKSAQESEKVNAKPHRSSWY
jgi:hypothetical protein